MTQPNTQPVPRTYYYNAAALFVLLGLTIVAGQFNLGAWSLLIGLLIAGTKAALIAAFFMHLRYTNRITVIFACAGLFWLAILIVMTLGDAATRGWLRPIVG